MTINRQITTSPHMTLADLTRILDLLSEGSKTSDSVWIQYSKGGDVREPDTVTFQLTSRTVPQ